MIAYDHNNSGGGWCCAGTLAGVIAPPESETGRHWPALSTEHSGARDELITRRGELWAVVTTPCLHCTGPVLVYCALYYEITAPGGYRGQL